jgi:hypothetical protein
VVRKQAKEANVPVERRQTWHDRRPLRTAQSIAKGPSSGSLLTFRAMVGLMDYRRAKKASSLGVEADQSKIWG